MYAHIPHLIPHQSGDITTLARFYDYRYYIPIERPIIESYALEVSIPLQSF